MSLSTSSLIFAIAGSILVGASKTGIPGAGILAVILIANIFTDGRLANGAVTPLLILADVFAVLWYSKHTRWDKVRQLAPSVAAGFVVGLIFFLLLNKNTGGKNVFNIVIGLIVLIMLAIHLLRKQLGDRLSPTTPIGRTLSGSTAGFATFVANAAGPIMSIYMAALKLPKEQFMGTTAWFFFIFNMAKIPLYFGLQWYDPSQPTFSLATLQFDLWMAAFVILGVFIGRWMLPRVSQSVFEWITLSLAGAAAVRLLYVALL